MVRVSSRRCSNRFSDSVFGNEKIVDLIISYRNTTYTNLYVIERRFSRDVMNVVHMLAPDVVKWCAKMILLINKSTDLPLGILCEQIPTNDCNLK